MSWNQDTDVLRVAIGDMNITGVQNDIATLAKDTVRGALNAVLTRASAANSAAG